ncbi:MAG: hypothetical protein LPJ89_01105 [Hymenobacteraceae bacterium]|nr:hypothetical protein [Hymenobacteraceae bacterium]MDX5397586.1 hypothetical protein [Hymenobacteraceae bacterium]MDX5442360.1 hypothetical protein [Hymenobacteraceae bacterium]MDX5513666.1 hypothetical protein [Hymenobacteraceae bacterium]
MTSPEQEATGQPASSTPNLQEYISRFEERPTYEMRISSGKKATYFCKAGEGDYKVYTIRKGTGKLEEPLREAHMEDKETFYMVLMLSMNYQSLMAELDDELGYNEWWENDDNYNYNY